MEDRSFQCPYCFTGITKNLNPSAAGKKTVVVCEVCCSPIEIGFEVVSAMA